MADAAAVPAIDVPGTRLRHLPALDGLRALAVVAVLLFHSGFDWAGGGFLGVTVFFVLSGYLIGGILLAEHDARATIDLGRFWARRCRRLVPGVLVLVVVVAGYLAWGADRPVAGVVGDAVASLTWVANWRFVIDHHSYSDLFSAPTPFQHMWSLAIEEQFYLALPVLAALLLGRGGRRRLGWGVVVGIVASTAAAALLGNGGDAGRAYYGTDARVAEPLIGVLLAVLLVSPAGRRAFEGRARRIAGGVGVVGVLGLVVLITSLTERSVGLYRGGFLLTGLLSAAVVVAATQPATLVARVLSSRPLVGIGKVSYGVYLFHWPLFLWLTPGRTGLAPAPLLGVRVAVTLGLAWVSYVVVESPIRNGRLPGRVALVAWGNVGLAALAAVVIVRPVVPPIAGFTDEIRAAGPVPTLPTAAPVPSVAAVSVVAAPSSTTAPRPATTAAPTTSSTARPTERPRSMPDVEQPPAPAGPPPTTSSTTTSPSSPPPTGPPLLAGPVKIAVVGDSMAAGLAAGLESWARGHTDVLVYDLTTSSCPLSAGGGSRHFPDGTEFGIREECAWWTQPSSDRMRKFVAFDPDVVVAQDAMNELLDRRLPEWSEYRHVGLGDFDRWLTDQYTSMARALTRDGARMLLLDAACADWWEMGTRFDDFATAGEGDRRVAAMRRLSGALRVPGVQVVDFFGQLCPGGAFTQTVGGVEDGRPDGYHLSVDAAAAVASDWLGPMAFRTGRPEG